MVSLERKLKADQCLIKDKCILRDILETTAVQNSDNIIKSSVIAGGMKIKIHPHFEKYHIIEDKIENWATFNERQMHFN